MEMFGPAGLTVNLCGPTGMDQVLVKVSDFLLARTTRVCLPTAVTSASQLSVSMQTGNDSMVELAEGFGPNTYSIQDPAPSCCAPDATGDCSGSAQALVLNFVAEPEALISVRYR